MALPFSFIGKWDYTNPATPIPVNIPMTDKPDYIFVKNITNWGDTTAVTSIESEWYSSMTQGSYISEDQTVTTNALSSNTGTTGGFTFVDQTNPPTYTKVAVTAVDGTTFVVTATNTSLNVGDWVRLINITGALELSSILFQVTSKTSTTAFTLGMAATAATAGWTIADGTTGFYQKVYPGFMYPKLKPILYITKATQAKVYFGTPNDFTPGELVDFQIPTPYGMTQLSNLTGTPTGGATANPPGAARVLVVTNTATESSITINYDTTGFTSFVYPVSATFASMSASPATCFPAGSGVVPFNGSATIPQSPPGTNLLDSFDNHAQYVMNLGTNVVGPANAHMVVMAFKADFNNAITNA